MSETLEQARAEINQSLILSAFCMRRIGFSFVMPKDTSEYWKQKAMFVLSMTSICYHVFGDIVYIGLTLSNSPRVEDVVPLLHTFGYGALSIAKVFVLWYKMDVFRQLLLELAEIWPMRPLDDEYQAIKDKSLSALSLAHRCYLAVNLMGVWFFNITPIAVYFYQRYWMQEEASVGYVWKAWYPFDKHETIGHVFVYIFEMFAGYLAVNLMGVWFFNITPIAVYFYQRYWMQEEASVGYVWKAWYPFDKHETIGHVFVYIFEMFAGQICVWIMVGTDLLFSGMASHIGLLLRFLQRRLECVGDVDQSDEDQYEEIKRNIRLHQRLIQYCNDLEDAFSLSNLVNVVFSSINICCVVFVIVLLEPLVEVSNKLFLGSALLQIGLICWYADVIFHANDEVAKAAYNSRWYVTNPRCRRALIFLIKRAQKPIAFTAMNFMFMNLVTYTAILTRSYSYFALLYTIYSDN